MVEYTSMYTMWNDMQEPLKYNNEHIYVYHFIPNYLLSKTHS